MTKVCHITNVHPQRDVRIFEKECVSLANLGYEVHLVAPGENCIANGVHIHGIGERPISRMVRMTKFARKAYEEAMKVDAAIYHFHDPELIPYGIKLKKHGKKVVFDSHENILDQFAEKEYIPKLLRVVLNCIFVSYLRHSCKKFDAIISVDPVICNKYKMLNPNTIMVKNYPQLEEIEYKKSTSKYICFAGGISRQWNHDVVINAIEAIDDLKYVLCGSADQEYLDYLQTLPGWRNVDYRGRVSHNKALELLQGGLAGVALCSYSRNTNGKLGTLGNTKLFEIMMCGIPVICTDFEAWKQIVEKGNAGYCIHPQCVDDLKKILLQLIRDENVSISMGKNGKRMVKTLYNWAQEELVLKELYESICRKEKS